MSRLKGIPAKLKAFLNIKEIPTAEGKTNFSDEQKEKMTEFFGEDKADKLIAALDKEAEEFLKAEQDNTEMEALKNELEDFLKDSNASADEVIEAVKKNGGDNLSLTEEVKKLAQQMIESNKAQQEMINKLLDDPEGDSPEARGGIPKSEKMQHSKTHLMGSAKAYNAFEGRNWNKQAAGISNKRTDWAGENGINIEKLNTDMDHYFREDPTMIQSLIRDNFGLPAHWDKKLNVTDEVADASIATAEITQPRKLKWLPKNKQVIKAEIGKIFPVQIDIEFVGKMLQDYEASWLSKWVGGGSSPYKDSFVQFLVGELNKQARIEDRISTIKGIYVPTPDDATKPGSFLSRQDGLLYQLWRAQHITKQIKVANVGTPTNTNIVDYVGKVIESNVPEVVRSATPLDFYLSEAWAKAYAKRYRQLHGIEMDFDGNVFKIENYPNVRFEILHDLSGTDVMFITLRGNIQILENVPAEKSLYRFEKLLRMIYVLADYKLGIRFKHIGNKVKDTDPDAFSVQTVWTNGVPYFDKSRFVPAFDDTTGELDVKYSNMQVDDAWDTNITELKNTYTGQVVKIRGNTSMANAKVVEDNADILLAGDVDFNLKLGGTLTLFIQEDGKAKELSRTTTPEVNTPVTVTFDDGTVDATEGSDQQFTGTAVTLTEIINGVEGQQLTLTQTTTNALTINDVAGNIEVASTAVLDAVDDTISFVNVDGVWTETSRTIAA